MLAATVGGSLLFNQHQKTKAQAQAAPQWRLTNQGVAHLTDRRLCLQGRLGWSDVWYQTIRLLEPQSDGILVYLADQAPWKIETNWTPYFYVLLAYVAQRRVIDVPFDATFLARAKANGRPLPPAEVTDFVNGSGD